ncbi:NAD-dependent epimerase/dehydratase family protein [Halobacteria archaeon AArc-dxtr1]|nr:NAD-dependent epimerase/dehydratase family protein [Halobacteria archaeon AArc-dxtr1]
MTAFEPTDQRILVTGGAGFIGSHLVDRLCDRNEVLVLDALTTGDPATVPDAATLIDGDIRDGATVDEAIAGVDLVFHEAALVSVDRSIEAPVESHEINARATLDLLQAARREGARVVLASSAAIYGQPDDVPIPESAPAEPASPYGLDKLATDHYARQFHDLYDLETVALRYFNVYGPGQMPGDYSGVISIFIEQALTGEPITVHGDGEQTRDFVFIDDIVQANLRAATTDAVGEAYNVATGEAISIRELAELIQELTDTESDIVHTDARTGDIDHSRGEISKATAALEYEPTVSLRDGLAQTVEWYRETQLSSE